MDPTLLPYVISGLAFGIAAVVGGTVVLRRVLRRDFGTAADASGPQRFGHTLQRAFGPDMPLAEEIRRRPTTKPPKKPRAAAPVRPPRLDMRLLLDCDPDFDMDAFTHRVTTMWLAVQKAVASGDPSPLRPFTGDPAYSLLKARVQSALETGVPSRTLALKSVEPEWVERAYGSSDPDNAYDRLRFRIESSVVGQDPSPATAGVTDEWVVARRLGAPKALAPLPMFCSACGARVATSGPTCDGCGAPLFSLEELFGSWVVKSITRS
jgi:predicted lipid-binding transport protein (Tim44 family)